MTRLIGVVAILFGFCFSPANASVPVRTHVIVLDSQSIGATRVEYLRVYEGREPAMVLVPDDARNATLEIDGVIRGHAFRDVSVGVGPLGHAMPSFTLAHVRSQDRVIVRVWGSNAPLRFVYAPEAVTDAHSVGLGSGAYYAILLMLATLQLAAFVALRDQTILWYFAFTLSLLGLEAARDGFLPFGTSSTGIVLFRSLFTFSIVGFSATYLRLRTQAPRLLVAAIACNVLPIVLLETFSAARHQAVSLSALIATDIVGIGAVIVIALIRSRSGFWPAIFLAFGLLGIPITFALELFVLVAGVHWEFLRHWGLETGATFDVLAFSCAVALRAHYLVKEREQIEHALQAATFEAGHDELTGLLNRRGLEAGFEKLNAAASTLLFIDLDGFKRINDLGGHAAGDDALKTTASILTHSVRANDLAARVGGDEFVIVLAHCVESAVVTDVTSRITSAVGFVCPLGAQNPTKFGVSIGSAVADGSTTFAAALAAADEEAYRIKVRHHASAREVKRILTDRREG